jgi:RNA polymerase sigma-70 factor (ECF subfamily)
MSQTLVAPATAAPHAADLVFEDLYRTSRDDVYAYALGLLRETAAAEDVTATAFERAYRKRRRFDARRGSPRAWLFGIARNAALDELRRRRRQRRLVGDPADEEAAQVTDPGEASELRVALREALHRLEPRERELIALRFFSGLSNAEIGAVLGISESNAGTRLHRTIAKLRAEVSHEGP